MCGNGAAIGTISIVVAHRLILKDLKVGRSAYTVAVAGAAAPGAVARRIVTPSARRTAATTLGCGWPFEFTTALSLCGRNSFFLT